MKIMFISDIHGSYTYLKKAMDCFEKMQADKLVILGDILYHGPRNPLPQGYDCQAVMKLLNSYKDKIIAVRGNCDAEVDQMVLEFDIRKDYQEFVVDGHRFVLTHGHVYNEEIRPPMNVGDILAYGHIHKPVAKKMDAVYVINPSSISLPKEGTNSYGVYENHTFTIIDFNGKTVKAITFE